MNEGTPHASLRQRTPSVQEAATHGFRPEIQALGPAYSSGIPNCVESEIYEPSPCSASRDSVSGFEPIVEAAETVVADNFAYFDTLSIFCDAERCHPVVGGLITHKDRGHIAATFMATVAPILAPTLERVAPEGFASR